MAGWACYRTFCLHTLVLHNVLAKLLVTLHLYRACVPGEAGLRTILETFVSDVLGIIEHHPNLETQ